MEPYKCLIAFAFLLVHVRADSIALYPQQTETRQVQSLDGVWNFRLTPIGSNGFTAKWFEKDLALIDSDYERMPVPSSYNDITEKREIRDFNGWVWYDRKFFIPPSWSASSGSILLRFGSVHYLASVYVNGQPAVNHTGGHLPFEVDATALLKPGTENHITVAVNNELSNITIPPGHVEIKNDTRQAGGKIFAELRPNFDFFNYAGIHRSVLLSYVPAVNRIVDLTVLTSTAADLTTGTVKYDVKTNAVDASKLTFDVQLLDREGQVAAKATTANGTLQVSKANLWWPFSTPGQMPGYLYQLAVKVSSDGKLVDSFYQKVGIRKVELVKNEFQVNGKAVYLRGFGKHEDMNIRGRSLDQATILKDFNLLKWVGANSFRTSHYPYAEAIMDEADEQGFLVIDEVPAVGIQTYPAELLAQHLQTIRELIQRDKNRPSVFMWSIANEPYSDLPETGPYFEKVAAEARAQDPAGRPITAATFKTYTTEYMSPTLDVIMINRYQGWYSDNGYPQMIQEYLIDEMVKYNAKFSKPIMISEYGADAISGLHTEPNFVFSEDYQEELLIEHHKAFDVLRTKGFFVGEHVWNFADFMTSQGVQRVGGNKKGIFTRDREPKTSARLLRCRYWKLSGDTTNPNQEGFSLCPNMNY